MGGPWMNVLNVWTVGEGMVGADVYKSGGRIRRRTTQMTIRHFRCGCRFFFGDGGVIGAVT